MLCSEYIILFILKLIVLFSLACISSYTNGLLYAWTSPSIPKIINDTTTYHISLEEASYFTVLPPAGSILTCALFPYLIDKIGRKKTLFLIGFPQVLAFALIAVSSSVYVLYLSRFVNGFSISCLFSTLPVYVGEIASPKVRGSWGNFMTFMVYGGQLSINIIGSYSSVETGAYICLAFPLFFLCTFYFMPETPYFYLMNGRVEEARVSLQRLRRLKNVDEELEKLKSDVDRQMGESGTWRDVFMTASNRRALIAGIFLRSSQQLGGISSFIVYTQYIFLQSGGDVSASTSSIIFMSLCTILNFFAGFALDRIGRRKSYIFSSFLCGIVLLGEAVYFSIEKFSPDVDLSGITWIPLAGMILYIFFYSFGLGIVPTLMLGELFSAHIKGKCLILLNIVYAILIASTTKVFHLLDTSFGLFSPFLLFAVCCLVSGVLAFYYVPETKGKTLEEIQQSLKLEKKT